jgi:hypothetical protein
MASGDEPAVVISGSVDSQPEAAQVVAAVDETIVAISPIYDEGGRRRFLLMLPVGPPVDAARVRFGLVTDSGELLEADRLRG